MCFIVVFSSSALGSVLTTAYLCWCTIRWSW